MDRNQKIKERKKAKLELESAGLEGLKERRSEEYSANNNKVKRRAKEETKRWQRRGLQRQKRPLRTVEARSYTALLNR